MLTKQRGVSLIELMVAVGVLGIISAIALPMYTDYIDTARRGIMIDNMQSIRLFEEETRMSFGAYQAGTYDPADPDNAAGLKTVIGWDPRSSSDEIVYVVSNVTATAYTVTATHTPTNTVETRNFTKP